MNRGLIMFLVAAAMLLAFVAGTRMAAAGNWPLFERACLSPMETLRPLQRAGLEPADRGAAGPYGANGEDVLQPLRGGGIVVMQEARECLVIVPLAETTARDLAQRDDWLADNLARERYRIVEHADTLVILHSTTWREPRLAVAFWTDVAEGVAVLSAVETNFEA